MFACSLQNDVASTWTQTPTFVHKHVRKNPNTGCVSITSTEMTIICLIIHIDSSLPVIWKESTLLHVRACCKLGPVGILKSDVKKSNFSPLDLFLHVWRLVITLSCTLWCSFALSEWVFNLIGWEWIKLLLLLPGVRLWTAVTWLTSHHLPRSSWAKVEQSFRCCSACSSGSLLQVYPAVQQ